MDDQIRKDLAAIVGSVDDETEDEEKDNITLSMAMIDVTGSLGVWGITQ